MIYLDNAATTRAFPEVANLVAKIMTEDYGNPSSMHEKGVEAEQYLRDAKEQFAGVLRVREQEIFFTSGGTESNNWALFGAAEANQRKGRHVITSAIEHAAVLQPAEALEAQGFEVTRIGVDEKGYLDQDALLNALREDTILVSCMAVNNEIGTIEAIREIAALVKRKNPDTLVHCDAVQAFAKLPLYPKEMQVDLLSASAHKIHGPKGVGLLYIDSKAKIRPLIYGGGQQKDMRSGTDNVPGIAGFALAAKRCCEQMEETREFLYRLKEQLATGLSTIPDVRILGPDVREGAAHILSASFLGVRSEVLLHALEERGICVSAGSACSTHKRKDSQTLTAIGCTKEEMSSAIRFSFCEENNEAEIEETLAAIRELLPMLRRFKRR